MRWACLAAMALLIGGCVLAPRRPDQPKVAPSPPSPPNTPATASVDLNQGGDPENEFHATATEHQRFQVHLDFGRVFEAQGNFDAAVLEYQDALTVVQTKARGQFKAADEALAHRRMAAAFDRLGRFPQAEVHYKDALKLSPKDPKVWNDAGYSYYLQGRWDEAERSLKTALKLAPDDERVRTNLGLTLAAVGRPQEALPLLSQSGGDATGHANLGYLLASTGQYELARQQYQEALAQRPDLALARRALAQLDRQERGLHESPTPTQVARIPHPTDAAVSQTSAKDLHLEDLPPLPSSDR